MKKVLFTIQIIALMAMFPVYLVTELNHSKVALPIDNSSSEITRLTENKIEPVQDDTNNGVSFLQLNKYATN